MEKKIYANNQALNEYKVAKENQKPEFNSWRDEANEPLSNSLFEVLLTNRYQIYIL